MKTLTSLLKGVNVTTRLPLDIPVGSVTSDSRHVWPGAAFVAIPGTKLNGNHYIPDAIQRGAAVIISNASDPKFLQNVMTPVVEVDNPRKALSIMAANFYKHPSHDMEVIGVTGTNGKTTTAYLIRSILSADDKKTGIIGTLGISGPGIDSSASLTTPDAMDLQKILKLFHDSGVTHVVMEVSSHALELNRVDDVEFDLAVFTNLSQDHLDFHGSMEEYFKAKTKLFQNLQKGAVAVINSDDEKASELLKISNAKNVCFSKEGSSQVHFENWGMSKNGITGIISTESGKLNISSSLVGTYNLENILAAVTAGSEMGISHEVIEKGITACSQVPGRTELFKMTNGGTVILDYAHTPDAFTKLFATLKMLLNDNGKMWVIFGCGGERDKEKRPLMAKEAERFANHIFITPDNPRTEEIEKINEDISNGFKENKHHFFESRGKAISEAMGKLGPNDILAVLGKGREHYQMIGSEKIPYSDYDTIMRSADAD
tara:strand:- start:10774 stop:12237 length:1464 start_codon:yes stop_codon:yes gene_type:complete